MKNLYNEADKNEILNRLENLKVDAVRQWGKMNIVQILAHLNVSLETPLGKNFPKRAFISVMITSGFSYIHFSTLYSRVPTISV